VANRTENRLRWYGFVLSENDTELVKRCVDYEVLHLVAHC